jgi:hypothetical protein
MSFGECYFVKIGSLATLVDEDILRLVQSFALDEPPVISLGTPLVTDTERTSALVAKGSAAVPALVQGLASEDAKVVMYSAYCLGLIGDRKSIGRLNDIRSMYLAKEPKGPYDYGVVSAANAALARLEDSV